MYEKKIKFMEQPTGPAPDPETVDPDTIDKYYETVNLEQEVACLMLSKQAKHELFETVEAFHTCKQEEGQSVSSYLLKMKSYLDTLERLGYAMPNEPGIPKKAETPAVLAIREVDQKDKKKPRGAKDAEVKEGERLLRGWTSGVLENEVENQLGKKIKAIRSDRGGEYTSHEFVNKMKSYGIVSQLTPPYTPQHNGVSERRNRTLLDMVQSMMNLTTLPKSFWGYALESAARILNMVPTKKVKRMPYEIWHVKAPQGCLLGETMGYYFYYPLENKIFVARNAEFFENSLMVQEASGSHGLLESSRSDGGLELIQEEDTQPSEKTSEIHNEVAPSRGRARVSLSCGVL
ncbi:retrotransposon protein, putative, ty1-copia subclass [Tanacetum coccineum]|uniref:Retrotransposon protein, putative, ty1-copia subclass n=1 Tax=Tanacetum coccineum TaxID=301880 RepID=A0ABQ5C2V3_9ASTR